MRAGANAPVHSSRFQDWETEPSVFAWLDCAFGVTIDLCATPKSAKCRRFYSLKENGLAAPWEGEVGFYNCRYKQTRFWVDRARDQAMRCGALSVGLLAARTTANPDRPKDSQYWDIVRDPDAGPLRKSYYQPVTLTDWRVYRDVIVGVHLVRERLYFLRDGVRSGEAPFDSAVVIFAPPVGARRPRAPRWSARELSALRRKMGRYADWPLLSEGKPW